MPNLGPPFLFAHAPLPRHYQAMAEDEPWLWMIAGPNGAGKTTFATQAIRDEFRLEHFVNTDEIARQLSPDAPGAAQIQSGRLMLGEFDRLRKERTSFAVETTLSSVSYLKKATAMRYDGWKVGLLYFWLASPELSQIRVSQRVAIGGHDVSASDIFRRYERSLNNLPKYLEVCDKFAMFDNSKDAPDLIAEGWAGGLDNVWNDTIVKQLLYDAYQAFTNKDTKHHEQ